MHWACTLLFVGCAWAQLDPAVPIGDPEGLPRRARRIEHHGITWTFAEERVVGSFANGDPWVLGAVAIVGIEPRSERIGQRVRHGSMVDPDPSTALQGYDSGLYGKDTGNRYVDKLNVALGVSVAAPLVLTPTQSLISVASRDLPEQMPMLQNAAVLTCVGAVPAPDQFRPPYVKGDKTLRHRVADLDFEVLQRLAPVGDMPMIESVARRFERLWLDHVRGWICRYQHPVDNMPDYGRDIASLVGSAGLMLNLDLPDRRKQPLLVSIVQLGIDNHGVVRSGGRWQGIGGLGHGRKLPILIAGQVLHDERMLAVGRDFVSRPQQAGGDGGFFGEDTQTFYVRETAPGEFNWGFGGYTRQHEGLPEWGFSHANHLNEDLAGWDANPYRRCCTANGWLGEVLTARVMGLKQAWHHDALFDYVDRYQQVEHQEAWHRSWVAWHVDMWLAYRANH